MSIVFELCEDAHLLDQYYQLRETCYQRELGIPDFDGSEEYQDRRGKIVLAHHNGQCVGGARISSYVPMREELDRLDLHPYRCCIWERFVVDPAARSLRMVRDFVDQMIQCSLNAGYHHAVMVSSMKNARLYRHCHSSLGVDFQIHHEVPGCAKGAFEGLEHYLSVSHLRSAQPARLAA